AAKPLFFLDYIAVGKNRPEVVADIVKGVSAGCIKAGCALIGGETAEMPGFYPEDEFDLAGFCVGLADKQSITDCASIRPGDVIVGMPSTGVHSNGFSLVRKLLVNGEDSMKVYSDELGMTVGEALLTPTEIYVKPLLALMDSVKVKGAAHITGGGFYENVPRMLPEGVCAELDTKAIPVLPIFNLLAKTGNIEAREMYNTFNMGVGMMVAVDAADADKSVAVLRENGIKAEIMGVCKAGETGVELK
ncbi:MAG: phosphoribosylformylglycinamidine cyclo-ligase, partial [Clostridia bacterium]|nr:phosphoribosylformylglycinamidine cyclo-ligase [Clostridia bacterium]